MHLEDFDCSGDYDVPNGGGGVPGLSSSWASQTPPVLIYVERTLVRLCACGEDVETYICYQRRGRLETKER